MTIEFTAWPKIARLNRDMIITEKIDGTNAAIGVVQADHGIELDGRTYWGDGLQGAAIGVETLDGHRLVYAQSRKRVISPEVDNHSFAKFVRDNAQALALTLGDGLHFGEYWGSGIQRGYGLQRGEKRFSLFNTPRYGDPEKFDLSPLKDIGVDTVPVLYEGLFDQVRINSVLDSLEVKGSKAAPGFMNPEGIIVFHVAAQIPFKVTIEGDEKPKGSNE